jgi:hypothetical protein
LASTCLVYPDHIVQIRNTQGKRFLSK